MFRTAAAFPAPVFHVKQPGVVVPFPNPLGFDYIAGLISENP
jgi:hypothetical protein